MLLISSCFRGCGEALTDSFKNSGNGNGDHLQATYRGRVMEVPSNPSSVLPLSLSPAGCSLPKEVPSCWTQELDKVLLSSASLCSEIIPRNISAEPSATSQGLFQEHRLRGAGSELLGWLLLKRGKQS